MLLCPHPRAVHANIQLLLLLILHCGRFDSIVALDNFKVSHLENILTDAFLTRRNRDYQKQSAPHGMIFILLWRYINNTMKAPFHSRKRTMMFGLRKVNEWSEQLGHYQRQDTRTNIKINKISEVNSVDDTLKRTKYSGRLANVTRYKYIWKPVNCSSTSLKETEKK